MSIFLIGSSFTTAILIPAKEFGHGGQADGRALSYLAHKFLGEGLAPYTISARSLSSGLLEHRRWLVC